MRPVPLLAAVLVTLAPVAACASPAPAPVAPAPVTVGPVPPAPAPPVPVDPVPIDPVPVTPAPVPEPPAGAVPAGGGSWTMPDLVGTTLQDAQDAIQALTDFAIPITTSSDATGRGRAQVLDRNWEVCAQNVPAGAEITPDTLIDFAVVQLDESC